MLVFFGTNCRLFVQRDALSVLVMTEEQRQVLLLVYVLLMLATPYLFIS